MRRACALAAALLALVQLDAGPTRGFTQSGAGTDISNLIPMGHEWITRRAAVELLLGAGNDPILPADPNDPRSKWTRGLAKNLDLSDLGSKAYVQRIKNTGYTDSRYQSLYRPIYDTIIGERWVDIGGFNVTNSKLGDTDCFDAVAQEPVEIQYDHFMRRYDDSGGAGGVQAAQQSQQRFVKYFVDAAMAPPTSMYGWDGGGFAVKERVDRNFFLFGRALHLFQDSFSSEHTVRNSTDNYETIQQVKSYLCAYGSEQHSHQVPIGDYTSGDAIWLQGTQWNGTNWATYKPSAMKTTALVAMEATKDLWAAFIRTIATPIPQRRAKAEAEAQTLVRNWLSFNSGQMQGWYDDASHRGATYVLNPGQSGPGQSQAACMQGLKVASGRQADKVAELEQSQRKCVFNVRPVDGYADLYDPQIHMPYNWEWVSAGWNSPPSGWQIPTREADTGVRVYFKSLSTQQYMTSAGTNNAPVRTQATGRPDEFIMVGSTSGALFRTTWDPSLFLSYAGTADGTVKLWAGTENSSFSIGGVAGRQTIMNLYYKQYIWVDGSGNVYLTAQGNPANDNARWKVQGLP